MVSTKVLVTQQFYIMTDFTKIYSEVYLMIIEPSRHVSINFSEISENMRTRHCLLIFQGWGIIIMF
jgi:hypothetical protein